MPLIRLSPITQKRLRRFRQIKRGYFAFVALVTLTVLSFFSEYLASNRALFVSYKGTWYFPTLTFHKMLDFGQTDPEGFDDEQEADYRRLRTEFKGTANWLVMPPIPWNPFENDFRKDGPPPNPPDWSARHVLGTDSQGRDVLARLIYGFRISMIFALALVLIGYTIGTAVGCAQGYLGGWFDILVQRVIEIFHTLPFLYIVIIFGIFVTPSFNILLGILLVFEWIGITYYMRSETYREKTREYCLAARALGASGWRVVFKHLLPNCLTPLVTIIPFALVGGIFALTSLDFLGYGLPPPTPSWGELIGQAIESTNRDKMWLVLSPFGAIVITLTLITLIGESIREAFDPKQYARYE